MHICMHTYTNAQVHMHKHMYTHAHAPTHMCDAKETVKLQFSYNYVPFPKDTWPRWTSASKNRKLH